MDAPARLRIGRAAALALAALLLTACEVGPEFNVPPMPEIVIPPPPAYPITPVAVPASTRNYGAVETFLGAVPQGPVPPGQEFDARGLVVSTGTADARERLAQSATGNQDRLVDDVAAAQRAGRPTMVTVTGNTDQRNRNTNNTVLASARARVAAESLARDLQRELGLASPPPVRALCPAGVSLCIQYQPNPGIARGVFAGRNATASVTFNPPVCCTGPADPGTPGGQLGGTPVFYVPPGTPGAPGTPAGPGTSGGQIGQSGQTGSTSTVPATSPAFDALDVALIVTVAAPNPFQVGGTLREQTVNVVSAVLYCGDAPCTGANVPTLRQLAGTLTISSTSATYARCRTSGQIGCQYDQATSSTPEFTASGRTVSGGRLTVRFYSPTPASVRVLPTLTLTALDVTYAGRSVPSSAVPVSVLFSGEPAVDVDGSFSVSRTVIGSTGS